MFFVLTHVVDRHRFHADPDLTFHFNADPDPDSDLDPTTNFPRVGKSEFFAFIAVPISEFPLFYLSRQRHRCRNFNVLDSLLKFSGKK
jgi:hypothetical protein